LVKTFYETYDKNRSVRLLYSLSISSSFLLRFSMEWNPEGKENSLVELRPLSWLVVLVDLVLDGQLGVEVTLVSVACWMTCLSLLPRTMEGEARGNPVVVRNPTKFSIRGERDEWMKMNGNELDLNFDAHLSLLSLSLALFPSGAAVIAALGSCRLLWISCVMTCRN